MKTINVLRSLLVMAILAVAAPTVNAAPKHEPTTEQKEQVQRMQNRLEEIKTIDKSTLSKAEKKALRGEVKQIKKEMKAISGGIYLSVGAILLIALLIILLA
jgi:septal ring factor EnvC (AmiA/AmiB activator)